MMQQGFKRTLSILLAIGLLLSCLAVPVFADETIVSIAEELQQQYVSKDTGAPQFGDITYPSSVGSFEKFEAVIDLSAEYDNPFDPDDITVNGVFTAPSGKKQIVPAYYTVPYVDKDGKYLMAYGTSAYELSTKEEEGWRVRFSADEIGQYSFYIEVRDSQNRTAFSQTKSFNVVASDNPGYVVVSETNPEYFETSGDGKLFYGSGANIAWVRSPFTTDPNHMSYNYFLNRAYNEGNNMIRIWMCHYAWLEWMPDVGTGTHSYAGLGYYNQHISSAFDSILSICEDYDLKVVLTLEDNNEHMGTEYYDNWIYNPYNIANGGPAQDTKEYFANEEVREYYKKRLRYIIARWGYSTSLFSLNMWNDCSSVNNINLYNYLKELHDYKNSITENYRPILMGSNYNGVYTDSNNVVYDINKTFDYTTQMLNRNDGSSPSLTQECFSTSYNYKASLHDTVWGEFMKGSAATMVWSHDDVDENDCYDIFTNVLNFAKDLPLNKSKYTVYPNGGKVSSLHTALQDNPYKIIEILPFGDASNFGVKATENEFYIDYDCSNMYIEGYNPQLYGNNSDRKPWKNPPNFYINAPNGGEFILFAGGGGSGTNILTATINGRKKELARWSKSSVDNPGSQYISIELKKGDNVITLDNTGNDWLSVTRMYVIFNATDKQDMVSVSTMRSDTQAIAYVYNSTYNYLYNQFKDTAPSPVTDAVITLDGFKDCIYEIKMYDPESGRYLYNIDKWANGKLSIDLPAYGSSDIPLFLDTAEADQEDNAISFKVDATNSADSISLRASIFGTGYRNTGGSSQYHLVAEDGTVTSASFAGERFNIPSGFKGTVVIPFAGFGGGGTMAVEDIYTTEDLSFSLYFFTKSSVDNFVISDIDFMNVNTAKSKFEVSGDAFEMSNLSALIADSKISVWGGLSSSDLSIDSADISLDIPYLEHDMIFSVTEKPSCRVQFVDPSGRVHDTVYVESGSTLTDDQIPALPSRTGYVVTGWSDQINAVIDEDTTIWALYEKDPNYSFKVTSTNGTVKYPGSKTEASFEDLIKVSADAEKDGVPFSHWEIDGVKVSESNPYAFRAAGSVCLTAVYAENAKETPGVFLNGSSVITQVSDTKFKFSMIGQSYIPDGFTLVEAGMLLAEGDKSADANTFDSKFKSGKFSTVGNITADDFTLTNKSLKMAKPGSTPSANSIGWQLEVAAPAGTDEAISLHINGSALTSAITALPYFTSSGKTVKLTPNASVHLYYSNGSAAKVVADGTGSIQLPAGFNGEIIVPFNAFKDAPGFDIVTLSLRTDLIFGITFSGIENGGYLEFNDLIFREVEQGAYFPVGEKQSPFSGYYEDVYQNFADATNDTASNFVGTWANAGHLPTISITNEKRISVSCSTSAHSYVSPKGSKTFDANDKGFSFYIDLSGQQNQKSLRVNMTVNLNASTKASFMTWYGATFYYISEGSSTVTEATIAGRDQWSSWVPLPAGFVGRVFIPLSAFIANPNATDVSNSYSYGLSDIIGKTVDSLNIQMGAVESDGDEVIFDDFCWLYDASKFFSASPFGEGWTQDMAQDFTGATTETLDDYASVSSKATSIIDENGALSVTYDSSSSTYFGIKPQNVFHEGADGISFHYDASKLIYSSDDDGNPVAKGYQFRVYINDKIGNTTYTLMPWYSKKYYFLPDGENATIEERTIAGGSQWNSWLSVTSGVSGTYYIPFDTFMPPESALDPDSEIDVPANNARDYKELAGQTVDSVQLMQSLYGGTAAVDNFCWVYDSMFTDGKTEERFQNDFYIGTNEYKAVKIPVISAYENSQFMISLTNVAMDKIRSGRAYIIVRDSNDQLYTYYSNTVCVAQWLGN